MPPEAPGRAARLALRQPAEQMLPGSEPISVHRAGASAGRESRHSPACQGCADSCQPAKAPGRRASTTLLATWKEPPSPCEAPQDLPPAAARRGTGPAPGAQGAPHPSQGTAGSQLGGGGGCRAGGQRAPALPGPVRAI